MSEIKSNEEPSLFIISPLELIFNLDTDNISELSSNTTKISKEIETLIINKSNDYIVIKISTTKKNNFITSPSSYLILSPKEEKKLNIRFKRDEGEKLKLKPYKFQFEGYIITLEEKDLNAKELFNKYDKNKNIIKSNVIMAQTKFLDKNGNENISLSNTNLINVNKNKEIKDINLTDLSKASNFHIILALIIAILIGLLILNKFKDKNI